MMKHSLLIFERRARFAMGILAALAVLAFACVKAGWISQAQQYKPDAWYAVDDRGDFVITSEHATEVGCRASNLFASVTCRSGKSLIADTAKARGDLRADIRSPNHQ
jgi:hypothetical protein